MVWVYRTLTIIDLNDMHSCNKTLYLYTLCTESAILAIVGIPIACFFVGLLIFGFDKNGNMVDVV